VFAGLGHIPVGPLDAAGLFDEMACPDSGCEVWQKDFLKLERSQSRFDGVFANAILFHVPSHELPRDCWNCTPRGSGRRAVQLESARP
jgi:hypothetical protein